MSKAVPLNQRVRRVPIAALIGLLGLALSGCRTALEFSPDDSGTVLAGPALDADDPSRPGSFGVRTLFYGSGTDKNRAEFRDSVAIVTESVDASPFVSLGDQAKSRNEYWGFSPDSFPINGRVWYPDGPGPFPVVLIVHGNHNPQDFSDPGYDYLGELLASRGYILTSVDMNFINGGIRGENDGRGWLLLKHLDAWKAFNDDPESPFAGKADLDRVGLIGHSRGGEAVGHAAAFNRLSRYPDDASVTFDFNYGIGAVIAIAPVDGQYLPTDRKAPLQDVNYLVFHGSHDGDVTSFHGLRQFNRIEYTGQEPLFKAAVYVYRANHGQWNSVWGPKDNGPRSQRILDLDALIPEEDQRRFGEVYVSAFLDTTLKGTEEYAPLFRDHRAGAAWLPKTMYFNQFQHSSFRALADFEGDIDVTRGSLDGVTLRGDSLAVWRESTLPLRSRNRANTSASQENQALWLGWNNAVRGQEELGPPARYVVELDGPARRALRLSAAGTFDFSLAPTDDEPGPRKPPTSDDAPTDNERDADDLGDSQDSDEGANPEPIDFSIVATDARGTEVSVPASAYGVIRRPLKIQVLRRRDLEGGRFETPWELVLQSFSVPLSDFVAQDSAFDPTQISSIAFVFDGSEAGTVVVDNVGFSNLPAAFLR